MCPSTDGEVTSTSGLPSRTRTRASFPGQNRTDASGLRRARGGEAGGRGNWSGAGGVLPEDRAALKHEEQIVWTEDVSGFHYMCQTVVRLFTTRRKPVGWNGAGRRVGYCMLKSDAPRGDTGRFIRRVFCVKDYDRSEQPDGTY
ncbi:DUF6009 family protein [Streptomyces hydrogenans]|uniref:DUF6009 family protein n=1 Tax=Streptomyces hydrogenans TaxID=1873719 RepID=UPI0033275A91